MAKQIKSGIYKILNVINGKFYIGSAVYFAQRFGQHIYNLRNNKHPNKHLQASFNKYGEEAFRFEKVEFIEDISKLVEREQYYINLYDVCNSDKGYNIAPKAGSQLGYHHTEKTREKLRNRIFGPEFKEKQRLAKLGKKASEETKEKMSEAHKGIVTWNKGLSGYTIQPKSEEAKEKIGRAVRERMHKEGFVHPMQGKHHTLEVLENIKSTQFKKGQNPWNKGSWKDKASETEIVSFYSVGHTIDECRIKFSISAYVIYGLLKKHKVNRSCAESKAILRNKKI